MIKKIVLAFGALVLLAGCSSSVGRGGAATTAAMGTSEFAKEVGDRVFFEYDKSNLSAEAKELLNHQATWLNNHPNQKVMVEGHCDERGTKEYNIALGERRATAAAKFLMKKGIDSKRIETISYGKERPAVIGNSPEAYSKNRRAVTVPK